MISTSIRQAEASSPEDQFVELFAQTFGLEKAQLLAHEYPFRDIYDMQGGCIAVTSRHRERLADLFPDRPWSAS